MTVSTILPVNNYTGNNSVKSFDFDFLVQNQDELEVFHTDKNGLVTVLQLGIDYSIDKIGNENGSFIIFPLDSSTFGLLQHDETITLSLALPIKQESEFANSSSLNLYILEQTFDYIVRILQILDRKVQRCLKTNEGISISPDDLMKQLNLNAKAAVESAQISGKILSEVLSSKDIVLSNKDKVEEIVSEFDILSKNTISELLKNGINTRAKTDFTNLEEVAEKHFLNKSQITNCLLEVPNRIKLELNNGVVTLKAGSTPIIPNGVDVFDYEEITNDLVLNQSPSTYSTDVFLYYNRRINAMSISSVDAATSGLTEPTSTGLWYDTTTNTIRYKSSTTLGTDIQSFPLAILTRSGGVWTGIKQIFNGFGYIGNSYWCDKGVKALLRNGKNPDETYKNIEYITDKFSVKTLVSGSTTDADFYMCIRNGEFGGFWKPRVYEQVEEPTVFSYGGALWINPLTNEAKYHGEATSSNWSSYPIALVGGFTRTASTGKIANFQVKQPFRAVDYNEYQEVLNAPHIIEKFKINYSWYRVWSDGWCEQGGIIQKNDGANVAISIELLKKYADDTYFATAIPLGYGDNTYNCSVELASGMGQTFNIYPHWSTKGQYIIWKAQGYIN